MKQASVGFLTFGGRLEFRIFAATTALGLVVATSTCSGAVVDGVVSLGEYGAPLAVQNTPTGFGDPYGSELNAAFANLLPNGSIELALTGNLEAGGNSIVMFFDTRAGGAVTTTLPGGYGQLGAFGGQRTDDWGDDTDGSYGVYTPPGGASILGVGFNPDFAIEFNTADGNRYLNVVDMTVGGNDPDLINRDVYLGSAPIGSGPVTQSYYRDGGLTLSGEVTHDFDNSNVQGVGGYDPFNPPGVLGDPLTATTGLEMLLSADFLATDPGHPIKLLVFISNGGGDYLSNQFLPGLGNTDNLGGPGGSGGDPLFDARLFAGDGYMVIPEPTSALLLLVGLAGIRHLRPGRNRSAGGSK